MKPIHRQQALALSALAVLLALGGCDSQELDRAQAEQAARNAGEATRAAGANAAEELKDASARAAVVTAKAAEVTREAAGKVAERLEDALITAKVTTGLAADKNLTVTRIDVRTRDGVVTLKGPAPSAAARVRAEEIARNVKGVTSVDNQLSVQSG